MSVSGLNGTLIFGIIIIFIVLGFGILFYGQVIPGFSLFSKQEKKCPTNLSDNSSSTGISTATTINVPNQCGDSSTNTSSDSSTDSSTTDNSPSSCPSSDHDGKPFIPPKEEGEMEVFNIRNNIFSYDDAKKVCRAFGSELASFEQVQESYNEGSNWCNYGWTKGQMALYPTQYSEWKKLQDNDSLNDDQKNSCGRPGINGGYFDNPNLKFGVNCYGVKSEAMDEEMTKINQSQADKYQTENDDEESQDDDLTRYETMIRDGKIQRNPFKCGLWNKEEDNEDSEN